ncbi:hypothetical protein OG898_11465 [Streptomyces sp. NBC_00193]|uniref:hypothetical protein n=1 Tax=unclassified Streptomyces TaxID=2593676 RepID=UPI002250542C|nr:MULTISPECIES: hypothetical protein [unclassified Streptomyces]MCX5123863.1 hypothetical protein [Streptomyces sp. NBC_00347]MCX5297108.1 hypothetical protein [Streptomyces sp. NBC_00193]
MTDVKADERPAQAWAELPEPAEPEPAEPKPAERAHWLQRSTAGLATLLMVAMTAFCATSPLGMVLLLPLVAVTWTLFVRERDAFRTLCIAVGGFGLVIGILLAFFGFFPVVPSAIVLLLAAWADPRRSPAVAWAFAALAAMVAALALTAAGALAYNAYLRPSYAYSVDITGSLYSEDGLPKVDFRLDGVTGVHEAFDDPVTRVQVTYDKSLTGPERAALREALREVLKAFPGAGPLKDCGIGDCD